MGVCALCVEVLRLCRRLSSGIFGPREAISRRRGVARSGSMEMDEERHVPWKIRDLKRFASWCSPFSRSGGDRCRSQMMASREGTSVLLRPQPNRLGKAPVAKRFRMAGMVVKGSVTVSGRLESEGRTDRFRASGPGRTTRVLPDLFVTGRESSAPMGPMGDDGAFRGRRGLAKPRRK